MLWNFPDWAFHHGRRVPWDISRSVLPGRIRRDVLFPCHRFSRDLKEQAVSWPSAPDQDLGGGSVRSSLTPTPQNTTAGLSVRDSASPPHPCCWGEGLRALSCRVDHEGAQGGRAGGHGGGSCEMMGRQETHSPLRHVCLENCITI